MMTMQSRSASASAAPTDNHGYEGTLRMLSEGSVRRRFDPYRDIDWNAPEFDVAPDDPRWVLPGAVDSLGSHRWYLAQPLERRIRIGMLRQANVTKVGLQFEQILIGGVMNYLFKMRNGSPEFRYLTHEVIEECNHTMMFQEMVNRVGSDVTGMGPVMRRCAPLLPLLGRVFPATFFVAVLAGEEPIDHVQKQFLRADVAVHPIMAAVMRIHIAEEARHISFAHEYLRHVVPRYGIVKRGVLSLFYPLIMFIACNLIMRPPRRLFHDLDIPMSIRKQLYWGLPAAKAVRRDLFGDVRMLAAEIGLMNPLSRRVWKMLRIDGEPSQYRGEPVRTHQVI